MNILLTRLKLNSKRFIFKTLIIKNLEYISYVLLGKGYLIVRDRLCYIIDERVSVIEYERQLEEEFKNRRGG